MLNFLQLRRTDRAQRIQIMECNFIFLFFLQLRETLHVAVVAFLIVLLHCVVLKRPQLIFNLMSLPVRPAKL